jgi:hypothetical protein
MFDDKLLGKRARNPPGQKLRVKNPHPYRTIRNDNGKCMLQGRRNRMIVCSINPIQEGLWMTSAHETDDGVAIWVDAGTVTAWRIADGYPTPEMILMKEYGRDDERTLSLPWPCRIEQLEASM